MSLWKFDNVRVPDVEAFILEHIDSKYMLQMDSEHTDPDTVVLFHNGDTMTINIKSGIIDWDTIEPGSFTRSHLAMRIHQWFGKGYIVPKTEKSNSIDHFVDVKSKEISAMTVACLKALLENYPDDSYVFISEDARTSRQITGFMGAFDRDKNLPYLVLTTRKDAPNEIYERPTVTKSTEEEETYHE